MVRACALVDIYKIILWPVSPPRRGTLHATVTFVCTQVSDFFSDSLSIQQTAMLRGVTYTAFDIMLCVCIYVYVYVYVHGCACIFVHICICG